jgi:hypothetical protein
MSGPFAAENFAHGSYCVICAMTLQCKDERTRATLITGFEMKSKDEKGKPFEADFSMFIEPSFSTQTSSSAFVIGECKSFNRSDNGDYARARQAMQLFPGRFMFRVPFAAQCLSKNYALGPRNSRPRASAKRPTEKPCHSALKQMDSAKQQVCRDVPAIDSENTGIIEKSRHTRCGSPRAGTTRQTLSGESGKQVRNQAPVSSSIDPRVLKEARL